MSKIRITDDAALCVVRDLNTGLTHVATYYGEDVANCDLVVVKYDDGHFALRHILDIITSKDEIEYCIATECINSEVIGHVDTSAYEKAMEKADKKAEIFAKMEKRASEIEHDMYYKILAEQDEEMAKLYKAYSEL